MKMLKFYQRWNQTIKIIEEEYLIILYLILKYNLNYLTL